MPAPVLDPVQLLVMANRVDGITREMTNTLVRTCRSTTQLARDFSTSICTAQAELLTAPEGNPLPRVRIRSPLRGLGRSPS